MNCSAYNLPNLLTLTNLFCGCCAVLYLFHGHPETAAWFTLSSFICDYFDGMLARALKISSPLGKELDSLADVVSFGVVPGAMLYMLLANGDTAQIHCAALPAFILSAFSGLRLAKFNLDTRQTTYFMGLTTPACTLFVLGLTLSAGKNLFGIGDFFRSNAWLIYLLIPVLSALLLSEIPMFGLKLKSLDWKSNAPIFAMLTILALSVFFVKILALSITVLCYIAISILFKEKVTG
jgi:CDP-diacylglycerol---serine O-phosphatidyltransferase